MDARVLTNDHTPFMTRRNLSRLRRTSSTCWSSASSSACSPSPAAPFSGSVTCFLRNLGRTMTGFRE